MRAQIYCVCSKAHNLISAEQRDISGVNFGQWDDAFSYVYIYVFNFFLQSTLQDYEDEVV